MLKGIWQGCALHPQNQRQQLKQQQKQQQKRDSCGMAWWGRWQGTP